MSCTTRTTGILATNATTVIVGLGVLARVSPEFKAATTDISLTALVALVLAGLLGALIAPLLDHWTDPGPSLGSTGDDSSDTPSEHHREPIPAWPAPPAGSIR